MLIINNIKNFAFPWEALSIDYFSFETYIHLPWIPELSNLNKTKEEVPMYDPNLKLRERTYTKNSNPTTWPEMVRQNRDSDVDDRLYKVHHDNLLVSLVSGLARGLLWMLSGLLHLPARLMHQEKGNLPMKQHSPVNR